MIQRRKEYFKSKGCTKPRMISFLITVIIDILVWCALLIFMVLAIRETKTFENFLPAEKGIYLFLCITPLVICTIGIVGWIIFKPKNALKSFADAENVLIEAKEALAESEKAKLLISFRAEITANETAIRNWLDDAFADKKLTEEQCNYWLYLINTNNGSV